MSPWQKVKHLFELNDGSLPDIFVENLSSEELVAVYEWLSNLAEIPRRTTVWSTENQQDIPICEVPFPARAFREGRIASFRHLLVGLSVDGVVLPTLSVCLVSNELSLDYRMGSEWNEQKVAALFELLRNLLRLAPQARIVQADEGSFKAPNVAFSLAFEAFVKNFDA
jgi:hypothetical protein